MIGAFIKRYNNSWLLQRHGYLIPTRAREKFSRKGGLMFKPSTCPETRNRYMSFLRS